MPLRVLRTELNNEDLFPTPLGFNGINLDNYFPNQRSYNSVVYVHKRFLANAKESEKEVKKDFRQKGTECYERKKEKYDKGIQFDGIIQNEHVNKGTRCNIKTENDNLITQTVQFAKKLVPLIIPPETYDEPVFYTVKTKKMKKKPQEYTNARDLIYGKNKSKKIDDTFRKPKVISHVESLSIKESISHSSQNTLDDFNINESLTCTISGASERKYVKKEKDTTKQKKKHNKKIRVSNSFEALATETLNVSDGANIKIRLMNDTDKNIFCESLQIPIINAIKDCVTELNQYDRIDSELKSVHRFIKCNNEKLGHILDKITCIEKQMENTNKKQIDVIMPPNVQVSKTSKLEQLGEDLEESKDHTSEDETTEAEEEKKMYRSKSVIAKFDQNKNKEDKKRSLGGGEVSSLLNAVNEVASVVIPEKPNRIPTRFCWTDARRTEFQ